MGTKCEHDWVFSYSFESKEFYYCSKCLASAGVYDGWEGRFLDITECEIKKKEEESSYSK